MPRQQCNKRKQAYLGTMQRDAAIMAYNDVFLMMTAFLALAAVLILNMRD